MAIGSGTGVQKTLNFMLREKMFWRVIFAFLACYLLCFGHPCGESVVNNSKTAGGPPATGLEELNKEIMGLVTSDFGSCADFHKKIFQP